MDVHTHTLATNTERFAIRFWKEKTHQKVYTSTKSEEKPQKVLIVASFDGDDEKAQYASFKQIFLYGCLRLTCFTVTKLIIDSVHFEYINPLGGTPLLLYNNLLDVALK